MDAHISSSAFSTFFAWAPLVAGIVIYGVFYAAKRHEATETGVPIGQTYACAQCGRRALREHMTPQKHAGAVSWYCSHCASASH